MPKLVRSASLTGYIEIARSVGLDPDGMLAMFGLARHSLCNPDLKIPEETVRGLLEASAEVAGIENFGLRMAEGRTLSNLGALALLVREQPTVRKALEIFIQYMRLHTDSVSLHLEQSNGNLIIRVIRSVETPSRSRQAVELTIGVLCRSIRLFLGDEWRPRVYFTHSVPSNRDIHWRMFGSEVLFNCDFNGVICRSRDLDVPIRTADPALARYAQQYVDSIPCADETFSEKVRELVATMLSSGNYRMGRIAQHLGVDRTTVHRRLAEESKSFSEIVDAIRTEIVKQHMGNCERPLSDVAEMLGFSDVSAFLRWFKKRFGCSVSEWRANSLIRGKSQALRRKK